MNSCSADGCGPAPGDTEEGGYLELIEFRPSLGNPRTLKGQKSVLDYLELESQSVLSCIVSAGN